MKKNQLLPIDGLMKSCICVVIFLAFFAMFFAGCSQGEEGEKSMTVPVSERSGQMKLLAMLPENTQFFARFGSLEKLYEQFAVDQNSIMGIALKQKDISEIKNAMGFNPFNIQEARQAGFDTQKPFCMAVANTRVNPDDVQKIHYDFLGFLPVSDGDTALGTIRLNLASQNILFVEAQKNGVPVIKWVNNEEKGCFALADNLLYTSINNGTDPELFMEAVLAKKSSLINSENFQKVGARTDFSRDMSFYFDIADLAETARKQKITADAGKIPGDVDADQIFKNLRHYLSASMSADLGRPDLLINTAVALADGSEMKNIWNADFIDRQKALGITEPAVVLFSVGRDFKRYYQMIREMMTAEQESSLETGLDKIKAETGIDPKTDIIDNLSGSLNFGLYDGSSITMLNYNALLTAGIKNEKLMGQVIERIIKNLPPDRQAMVSRQEVGKVRAYVLNAGLAQVYVGIDDNRLVLTSGKPIFEKALTRKKEKGFAANLADESLKASLLGSRNIFYLNVDEVVKTVNNFAMFLAEPAGGPEKFRQKLDAASKFEYVLFSSGLNGDIIDSEFTVKTRFEKPFFVQLADMISEFDQN
jgi:hypothetical protein